MTAALLEFGNLSLPWITTENVGIEIYSTPYELYDGRTIVAGVTQTGKRPTFNGIAVGTDFVDDVIAEVGSRHNLSVDDSFLGIAQIIKFDYSYYGYSGGNRYFKYTLGFATENLS